MASSKRLLASLWIPHIVSINPNYYPLAGTGTRAASSTWSSFEFHTLHPHFLLRHGRYWNQGGLSNVVSMFLYLLDAYHLQVRAEGRAGEGGRERPAGWAGCMWGVYSLQEGGGLPPANTDREAGPVCTPGGIRMHFGPESGLKPRVRSRGVGGFTQRFLSLLWSHMYCPLQPAVPPPEPLIETPPLGCLHPLYRGGKAYFATPAEYMKWCVEGWGGRWEGWGDIGRVQSGLHYGWTKAAGGHRSMILFHTHHHQV